MGAKVTPALDPTFISPQDSLMMLGSGEWEIQNFKTIFFRIMEGDQNGDKARYENFIKSLFPYSINSRLALNSYTGVPPVQQHWTNEGDLIIYIEYVQHGAPEPTEEAPDQKSPDERAY